LWLQVNFLRLVTDSAVRDGRPEELEKKGGQKKDHTTWEGLTKICQLGIGLRGH